MKINTFVLAMMMACLSFIGCKNEKNINSQAHQTAVELTQEMKTIHDDLKDKFDSIKEESNQVASKIQKMNQPDAKFVAMVKEHHSKIAQLEGLLKVQAELIKQHEEYIEKHETSAMTAAEIKAQHQQMESNHATILQQKAQMMQEINKLIKQNAAALKESEPETQEG